MGFCGGVGEAEFFFGVVLVGFVGVEHFVPDGEDGGEVGHLFLWVFEVVVAVHGRGYEEELGGAVEGAGESGV